MLHWPDIKRIMRQQRPLLNIYYSKLPAIPFALHARFTAPPRKAHYYIIETHRGYQLYIATQRAHATCQLAHWTNTQAASGIIHFHLTHHQQTANYNRINRFLQKHTHDRP